MQIPAAGGSSERSALSASMSREEERNFNRIFGGGVHFIYTSGFASIFLSDFLSGYIKN